MKLRELLQQLQATQQKIDVAEAWICGGTPRDRYLNKISNVADIDLTNGEKTISYLSEEFYNELKKKYNITIIRNSDGHNTLHLGSLKIDFSSNFNIGNIDKFLLQKGIKNPTSLQKEMYSRDFTCNALLLSLDLKTLLDPTHQGFKDITDKIIKCCLDPKITLTTNKNRVIRAIYLSAKLDFDIDPAIIQFVKEHPQSVKISTNKVMTEKLNEAFKRDPDRSSDLLTKMNLWNYIPIPEIVYPYYAKHQIVGKQVHAYFQGGGGGNEPTPGKAKYKSEKAITVQPRFKDPFYRNFDLYDVSGVVDGKAEHGPGAGYNSLQNFKSITDFLEARRKRLDGKYVAKDTYIMPDNYQERADKMKTKKSHNIFEMTKRAIDFEIDNSITPIIGNSESFETPIQLGPSSPDTTISPEQTNLGEYESYPASAQLGGYMDRYLGQNDPDDKTPADLDYGQDLTDDESPIGRAFPSNQLDQLEQKYQTIPAGETTNHGQFGLPDGVDLPQDEDPLPETINPDFGTTDLGIDVYEDKWNV